MNIKLKEKYRDKEVSIKNGSNFEEIITNNLLYIDKTEYIDKFMLSSGQVFMQRPRGFGKSLTLDVMRNIFEGNQELFKDLYLGTKDDNWWKQIQKPVIMLDFTKDFPIKINEENIDRHLMDLIIKKNKNQIEKNSIDVDKLKNKSMGSAQIFLDDLIELLREKTKKKVVFLVDEYDKWLNQFISEPEKFELVKKKLVELFSVTKGNLDIHSVTMFGISRFSKDTILSGLNHLEDLSYDEKYLKLMGVTEDEILEYFDVDNETLKNLRKWYNGFKFNYNKLDISVYNPFSLFNAISKKIIDNYWVKSGTPKMLLNYIKSSKLKFEDMGEVYKLQSTHLYTNITEISNEDEIIKEDVYRLLFQTGYLTIKEKQDNDIILDFPNVENSKSFSEIILRYFFKRNSFSNILDSLKSLNSDNIKNEINNIFKEFTHDLNKNNKKLTEDVYHKMLSFYFKPIADKVIVSKSNPIGESDMIVEHSDNVYIFEFKIQDNYNKNIDLINYSLGQIYSQNYLVDYENNKDNNIEKERKNKKKNIYFIPVLFSNSTYLINDLKIFDYRDFDKNLIEKLSNYYKTNKTKEPQKTISKLKTI